MANVAYINASTDSYWIRDYGPWFIFDGGELKVVDFEYNRPRPNDDIIPVTVATRFGLDYYTMDLVANGGNIMCDGHEAAMSTQLIAEENTGYTEAEIEADGAIPWCDRLPALHRPEQHLHRSHRLLGQAPGCGQSGHPQRPHQPCPVRRDRGHGG